MADTKISDLTAIAGASLASTDLTVVVDVSDTTMAASGTDKKTTVADLATAVTTIGALATDAEVTAAVSAHTAASDPHGDRAFAASAVSTHEADTTSVHGITDTSTLYRSGGTDVAVADGGTGSSTASGARTNLGLVIGTDVQAYDADLTALAAIAGVQGDVIYHNGTAWVKLPAGTSGQFLKTLGAGANPAWAAAGGGGSADGMTAAPLAANIAGYGIPGRGLSWGGTVNLTQGFVYAVPFACSETESFDAYDAYCNTGVASTSFDIAIFSCANWRIGATASKVAGTEVVATSLAASGAKTITLAAPVALAAGRYCIMFTAYGGAGAVNMWSVSTNANFSGARIQSGTGAAADGWIQAAGASSLAASYSVANAGGYGGSIAVLRRG